MGYDRFAWSVKLGNMWFRSIYLAKFMNEYRVRLPSEENSEVFTRIEVIVDQSGLQLSYHDARYFSSLPGEPVAGAVPIGQLILARI